MCQFLAFFLEGDPTSCNCQEIIFTKEGGEEHDDEESLAGTWQYRAPLMYSNGRRLMFFDGQRWKTDTTAAGVTKPFQSEPIPQDGCSWSLRCPDEMPVDSVWRLGTENENLPFYSVACRKYKDENQLFDPEKCSTTTTTIK